MSEKTVHVLGRPYLPPLDALDHSHNRVARPQRSYRRQPPDLNKPLPPLNPRKGAIVRPNAAQAEVTATAHGGQGPPIAQQISQENSEEGRVSFKVRAGSAVSLDSVLRTLRRASTFGTRQKSQPGRQKRSQRAKKLSAYIDAGTQTSVENLTRITGRPTSPTGPGRHHKSLGNGIRSTSPRNSRVRPAMCSLRSFLNGKSDHSEPSDHVDQKPEQVSDDRVNNNTAPTAEGLSRSFLNTGRILNGKGTASANTSGLTLDTYESRYSDDGAAPSVADRPATYRRAISDPSNDLAAKSIRARREGGSSEDSNRPRKAPRRQPVGFGPKHRRLAPQGGPSVSPLRNMVVAGGDELKTTFGVPTVESDFETFFRRPVDGYFPSADLMPQNDVPDHLSGSLLCPLHPQHRGGQKMMCPLHGYLEISEEGSEGSPRSTPGAVQSATARGLDGPALALRLSDEMLRPEESSLVPSNSGHLKPHLRLSAYNRSPGTFQACIDHRGSPLHRTESDDSVPRPGILW